jgi:ATP synthase protein I
VIGWGLDSLAGLFGHRTFPLFFLLMLFFGFGVGVRNIMRLSKTRTPPGN